MDSLDESLEETASCASTRASGPPLLQSFSLIILLYFLLILAVYSLGGVDIIMSTPLIFSFAPYLPFASLTFLWT